MFESWQVMKLDKEVKKASSPRSTAIVESDMKDKDFIAAKHM